MGGGHDEREQTLNQLLVEMDGFGVNEGIIVYRPTSRHIPYLRHLRVRRSTVRLVECPMRGRGYPRFRPRTNRWETMWICIRSPRRPRALPERNWRIFRNEAAILAAKGRRAYLNQADIQKAFVKVGIGTEKKSKVISEKEKRITAYHEAGHGILFHVLPEMEPVYTISIIPTGMGAAGYTMPLPENDDLFNTREKMLQHITVALGGRVAEEMIFDDITTGASQDIKQATAIAKAMVTKYGMSSRVGMVTYGDDENQVFIGRDLAHARGFSEHTAAAIDEEVREIIDNCYAEAKRIIGEHIDVLHSCSRLLLEKEKIGREEFEALFEKSGEVLPQA